MREFEPGSLLAQLPEADVEVLCAAGVRRGFGAGAAVFVEGDDSDHVVLLLAGRVKVTCTDVDGRETVLAIRAPGDALGELSAIDKQPRSANAYALEPAEVVLLSADQFTEVLRIRPGVALAVLELLTTRLRESDRHRIEYGARSALARVAARLIELHERFPDGNLRLTQDELAAWVGCSREAAAKALAVLRSKGLVRTGRRRVEVVDPAGLENIAGV